MSSLLADAASAALLLVQVIHQPRKPMYPERPRSVHPYTIELQATNEVR